MAAVRRAYEGWPRGSDRSPKTAGLTYSQKMIGPITPKQLSAELGVSDRAIRQWLRDQGWQSVPYARWELTPEQAEQVRAHFRAGADRQRSRRNT